MPLSSQDISRIAHLARLSLDEPSAATLRTQLNGFFELVEQMNAVDTEGVEPLYQPISAIQETNLRLREDAIGAQNIVEEAAANAPLMQDGLFLVPRVVE